MSDKHAVVLLCLVSCIIHSTAVMTATDRQLSVTLQELNFQLQQLLHAELDDVSSRRRGCGSDKGCLCCCWRERHLHGV